MRVNGDERNIIDEFMIDVRGSSDPLSALADVEPLEYANEFVTKERIEKLIEIIHGEIIDEIGH